MKKLLPRWSSTNIDNGLTSFTSSFSPLSIILLILILGISPSTYLNAQSIPSIDSLTPLKLSLNTEQRLIDNKELLYYEVKEDEVVSIESLDRMHLGPMTPWNPLQISESDYHYWTILKVVGQENYPAEWWARIPGNYSEMTLVRADGTRETYQGGDLVSRANRSIPSVNRKFSYAPIKLAPFEEVTLFFEVKASSYFPLRSTTFEIGSRLGFENAQFRRESSHSFQNGLYSAVLFIFILYSLAYLLYSREIFALWAILYALCLLFFFYHFTGSWYRWGVSPVAALPLGILFIDLSMFFELLFGRQFLRMKESMPKWNTTYVIALIYMGVATISHTAYYLISEQYITTAFSGFYIHAVLYLPHLLLAGWILWSNYKTNFSDQSSLTIYALAMAGRYIILIYTIYTNGPVSELTFQFIQISEIVYVIGIVISLSLRAGKIQRDKVATEIEKVRREIAFEELNQLDKLKSRFFANVSHELRTPLTLMLGPIRRLKRDSDLKPKQGQLLQFLERNTVHLRELVNEILDLAKLESSKVDLHNQPTQMMKFLDNLLGKYLTISHARKIDFQYINRLDKDCNLLLDRKKAAKILDNYLSNALKFTPDEGSIKLEVDLRNDLLYFTVEDSGPGISQEDIPYVFNRFYQSGQNDRLSESGTGIGLSICKELAEVMGGKVAVESIPGHGAKFHYEGPGISCSPVAGSYLPLEKVPTDKHSEKTLASQDKLEEVTPLSDLITPIAGSRDILVVDDNQDLRTYLTIVLEGYHVKTAKNGQEALDILEGEWQPNLIISDLMMPVMDGMQLLERLKSSDKYRHLPLIMLTAKTNQSVKIKALRYGIDDYLNKPFDEEELQVRIYNLLSHQAARIIVTDPGELTAVPLMSKADQIWLEELETYILDHLQEAEFSIAQLSLQLATSESTLRRQLKRLTGLTPKKYLQELRLNQARELLHNQSFGTIAEVGYKVGFKDPASFSRSFKKRFGRVPTEID